MDTSLDMTILVPQMILVMSNIEVSMHLVNRKFHQ